jgi:hypothetical protein
MDIGGGIQIGNGITITRELSVITAGLQLYLDAGRSASYSGTTTTELLWVEIQIWSMIVQGVIFNGR